jgi:creatinine amidohydrolase/Fe(II)-dependent formamide hydrolase-like protein
MMLRIAPNLVGNYLDAPVVEPGNPFRPASRAWITKDRSKPGHIGWPHLASVEKGEVLLATFSRDVTDLVDRMENWDGISWEG